MVSYPLTDQPIEDQQERKGDKAAKEEDGGKEMISYIFHSLCENNNYS